MDPQVLDLKRTLKACRGKEGDNYIHIKDDALRNHICKWVPE